MTRSAMADSNPSGSATGDEESDSDTSLVEDPFPSPGPTWTAEDDFILETILTTRELDDGNVQYLVKWEEYDLDQCTWEPDAEITLPSSDDGKPTTIMYSTWWSNYLREHGGEPPPFDKNAYNERVREILEPQRLEHEKRNAQRRAAGFPETEWAPSALVENDLDSDDEGNLAAPDSSESSDEAMEIDDIPADLPVTKSTVPKFKRPNPMFGNRMSVVRGSSTAHTRHTGSSSRSESVTARRPSTRKAPKSPNKQARRNSKPTVELQSSRTGAVKSILPETTAVSSKPRSPATPAAPAIPMASRPRVQTTGFGDERRSTISTNSSGPRRTTKMTAKRTLPTFTGNVFIGGKERCQRRPTADVAADQGRERTRSKQWSHQSHVTRSNKSLDELGPTAEQAFGTRKPSQPIAHSSTQAPEAQIPISPGSVAATEPKKKASVRFDPPPPTVNPQNPKTEPKASNHEASERSRVRFAEEIIPFSDEPTDMGGDSSSDEEDDDALFVVQDRAPFATPSGPLQRTLVLERGNHEIPVLLSGVFRKEAKGEAQRTFFRSSSLKVSHSVLINSLIVKLNDLSTESAGCNIFASGAVTSDTSSEDTKALAERLRSTLSALLVEERGLFVILYAARYSDPDISFNLPNGDLKSLKDAELGYFAFTSAILTSEMLNSSNTASMNDTMDTFAPLWQQITNIDYNAMTAGHDANAPLYFYLLSLPTDGVVMARVSNWISCKTTQNQVFSSEQPGGWNSFRQKSLDHGVIIVHHAAVWHIRRLPDLWKVLLRTTCRVFLLSDAAELQPIYDCDAPVSIGTWRTTMLFPTGKVMLLTPSFILSEPQQAWRAIKMVYDTRWRSSQRVIAVARDFVEEMAARADKLTTSRAHVLDSVDRNGLNAAVRDSLLADAKLSKEDIEALHKCSHWVSEMTAEEDTLHAPDTRPRSLIFADASVDFYDEQSLVNWFGWWSEMRMDKFRRFVVVGSKVDSPFVDCTIPHFLQPVEADSAGSARMPQAQVQQSLRATTIEQDQPFRSDLFDSEFGMRHELRNLDLQRKNTSVRVFGFPVSWTNGEEADFFNSDRQVKLKSMQEWLGWHLSWRLRHDGRRPPAFIGYFFTISQNFDTSTYRRGLLPKRHPWFVVYRPVPGSTPDRIEAELLIWDMTSEPKFANVDGQRSIPLDSLLPAQQALIEFVKKEEPKRHKDSFLRNVWIGGFVPQEARDRPPVDITFDAMKCVQEDLIDVSLRLYSSSGPANFRQVDFGGPPARPSTFAAQVSNPQSTDSMAIDMDDAAKPHVRLIWDPPASSSEKRPETLVSDFAEAVRRARVSDANAKTMHYKLKNTWSWYERQLKAGRGFGGHVAVLPWDTVLGTDGGSSGADDAKGR